MSLPHFNEAIHSVHVDIVVANRNVRLPWQNKIKSTKISSSSFPKSCWNWQLHSSYLCKLVNSFPVESEKVLTKSKMSGYVSVKQTNEYVQRDGTQWDIILPRKDLHLVRSVELQAKLLRWHFPDPANERMSKEHNANKSTHGSFESRSTLHNLSFSSTNLNTEWKTN